MPFLLLLAGRLRSAGRVLLVALSALTCATLFAQSASAKPSNLIHGLSPTKTDGVLRPQVLNDEITVFRGGHWKTNRTAVFRGYNAAVEFDLGKPTKISAAYLMGDNNDTYTISGSLDGKAFEDIWQAAPTSGSGMRARQVTGLSKTARYLRITARGGDNSYAIAELALYSEQPKVFPPKFTEKRGMPPDEQVRNSTLLWVLLLAPLRFCREPPL